MKTSNYVWTVPIDELIQNVTGATSVKRGDIVQRLWRGYGEIVRYRLMGSDHSSVIVKQVKLPGRGSSTGELSHRRKVRSYQIETVWYERWRVNCDGDCRVPLCFASKISGDEVILVLEDLDAAGFPERKSSLNLDKMTVCLRWLANFHAIFLGMKPENLWTTGTYWHLKTRPDELEALTDTALKQAAGDIDRKLKACRYQTVVHGDAKLANFCFSRDGRRVAAVDFQYVGGGCGIKDVAYFIDSCLDGEDSQRYEKLLLDNYFQALKQALYNKRPNIDAAAVEREWRLLYPVAWTDFHRFLKGWAPGSWHPDCYSERLARRVIADLQNDEGRNNAAVDQ